MTRNHLKKLNVLARPQHLPNTNSTVAVTRLVRIGLPDASKNANPKLLRHSVCEKLRCGSHGLFHGSCPGHAGGVFTTTFPQIMKQVLACGLCVEVKTPRALFFHILCRRLPTPPKDTSSVQHLLVDTDEVRPATEDSGRERGPDVAALLTV